MEFTLNCRQCCHTWTQTEKPIGGVKCPNCGGVIKIEAELFSREELFAASDALFEWVQSQNLTRSDTLNILFGSVMRVCLSMVQQSPELLSPLHKFLVDETNRVFDAWKAHFDAGKH